jgi:uncharacterized protein YeaO (DUF488 family)
VFQTRYYKELDSKDRSVVVYDLLEKIVDIESATLVYAAKDEKYNNAVLKYDLIWVTTLYNR